MLDLRLTLDTETYKQLSEMIGKIVSEKIDEAVGELKKLVPPPIDSQQRLTVEDVAKRLNLSQATIRRYARQSIITAIKTGQGYRFTSQSVADYERAYQARILKRQV